MTVSRHKKNQATLKLENHHGRYIDEVWIRNSQGDFKITATSDSVIYYSHEKIDKQHSCGFVVVEFNGVETHRFNVMLSVINIRWKR